MPTQIRLVALCLGMLAVQAHRAQADEWLGTLKAFHPYAEIAVTDDSNLLLTPDAEPDQYLTLAAGFATKIRLSRQRILIDARIYRNNYDRFAYLDYTGGNAGLRWKWLMGKLWEGDIGYTFDRRLRNLGNDLIPTRDLRDQQRVFASARRWLTTRWRLGGETDWKDVSFSERKFLNKTLYGLGLDLDYVSRGGNEVGIAVAYSASQYSNRDGFDYDDVRVGPKLDWRLANKFRLKADIGYKTRTYDVLSEKDFGGVVGRIGAVWDATKKTSAEVAVWRDISNLEDEVANYAVIDGVSLEPKWAITTKTSLRALASFERRDFKGGSPPVEEPLDLEERVDNVKVFGIWLDWNPRRTVSFSIGYSAASRDSTRELRDYDSCVLQASFSVGL